MNTSDLSKGDDFLSRLLVAKLGTGDVPLFAHKTDPPQHLSKANGNNILQIVWRVRLFLAATGFMNTSALNARLVRVVGRN